MDKIEAKLLARDRTLIKTIEIEPHWYVAPTILIDGDDYYIRTSDDHIHSPLEYQRVNQVIRIA